MLVSISVAIGDPLFSPGTDAEKVVVSPTSPDRVGVAQPEGRRIGSGRQVDEEVGLQVTQLSNQMDGGCKITLELAAGNNAIGVARAIELELVEAILAHELHAGIAKRRVVFRARKRKAVVHDFVAGCPSRRYALLFRLAVSAPGRHPNPGSSSKARGRLA